MDGILEPSELVKQVSACGSTFYTMACLHPTLFGVMPPPCAPVIPCQLGPYPCGPNVYCGQFGIPTGQAGALFQKLTEGLKACGGEFYNRCPAFDDMARVCDFEPAFEAAKWKEQVLLERVKVLESKVQQLETHLKK